MALELKGSMPLAAQITPHLPYLRRFARALTGSQVVGDGWVEAALKEVIGDPSRFPANLSPKVGIFRVFAELWNGTRDRNRDVSGIGSADRALHRLTPLPRQAFLLASVEGFSHGEVASILDVPEEQIADLLMAANQEIALQMSTDVLVIEDEPLIAFDLEHIVQELGHRLVGVARTFDEATDLAAAKRPGLILADIQLADGSSGIDAVNSILRTVSVPVIFITAFPILLLTGKGPEPTFLIAKPFEPAAVKAAVSQALFFDRKAVSHGS